MVGWYCGPAIFRALAPVLPEQVQAFTGLPVPCGAYGRTADGRLFNDHIMFGGGQGASRHGDGCAALMYPTSAGNVPVEMFEARTSLLVERKELVADSGGPGHHRGGLGQRMILRKLYDDGLPVLVNVLTHGQDSPMTGLLGGAQGAGTGLEITGGTLSGRDEASALVELRAASDAITVWSAGGSGFGDPRARPDELIARDLAEGYITEAGLAAYGREHAPRRARAGQTAQRP
jgi:5-oxoprolinase (ATP-hydrolysing)